MISLKNVSKYFGKRCLFDNLSFSINSNEKCALIGRNGTGKTTLFKLLAKKEGFDTGDIKYPNDYTFGYLDQHINFTKKTIIEESLINSSYEEWESEYKAEIILFGLGFKKRDMTRDPKDLSGGYQLRLHLAKVLLSEPSCLLLDEPTNYLDIVSIQWFKKFLKSFRGECIVISHDRDLLDSFSTHTLGLNRSKILKVKGQTKDYYDLVLLHEDTQESKRLNIEKKKEHLETYIRRFSAKASKASQAKSKKKALEKFSSIEKLVKMHSLKFSFNSKPFPGTNILMAENLQFSYENMIDLEPGTNLVEDFSLDIDKGQRIGIIGKNGYGKSTILKLIAGEISSEKGILKISENASIGYFGQTNINRLHPENSVIDEITISNPSLGIGDVRKICSSMMFAKDDAKKKVSQLSGGEKSRVLIGKLLAKPCNLLLLDEPTNHLDIESIEALLEALESFKGAIVIVTHSEMILERLLLDRLVICHHDKQTNFLGNYEEFLEKLGWPDSSKKKEKKNKISKKKSEKSSDKNIELRNLKKEISKIEMKIVALEKVLENDNQELLKASQNFSSEEILNLSQKISKNQKEIEKLFENLEVLTIEYEKKSKEI